MKPDFVRYSEVCSQVILHLQNDKSQYKWTYRFTDTEIFIFGFSREVRTGTSLKLTHQELQNLLDTTQGYTGLDAEAEVVLNIVDQVLAK